MGRAVLPFLLTSGLWAQSFVNDVLPAIRKAGCTGCHQPNGVASTTRLVFPDAGAAVEEWDAYGDTLRRFVDKSAPEKSLLVMKPANKAPHGGGERIKPGSAEEAALLGWARHLASSDAAASRTFTREAGEKKVLRRLTHSQYDRTVRDLLGDFTLPSKQFPPEDFIEGFKTQYEGQSVSPILAEAYGTAAETLAANWRGEDTGPRFVAEFGKRAFRRPLTKEELTEYGGLYKAGRARLVIEAMLQSPAFLYRMETTTVKEHQPYARATRLSYMLWDTMPDAELFRAAERGELDTPAGVAGQVKRMLADGKARQAIDEFASQWFRFDTVLTMVKERRSYPQFTRELALAMTEETRRLVADLVWNDGNFMDLYTAGYTFLNPDLASLYKLPPPTEEFARVDLPDASGRAGVLGHASFLAMTSKPSDTSITARGLFVREHFLCQQVPQPPPGVNANLPVQSADKPMTNRERLQVHLVNPACASCHNLIDPIGYGLENFDGVGAHRASMRIDLPRYNRREDVKTVEIPIDAAGWITGIRESDFATPRTLGRILADNPQCQECVVKQFFRFTMGRHETPADKPVIDRIVADFRQSGFRFQRMLESFVQWTEFPARAGQVVAKGNQHAGSRREVR
ncbi:MAG: DUF1592 domain-containing protein [Bryobacteraceae bacterium]